MLRFPRHRTRTYLKKPRIANPSSPLSTWIIFSRFSIRTTSATLAMEGEAGSSGYYRIIPHYGRQHPHCPLCIKEPALGRKTATTRLSYCCIMYHTSALSGLRQALCITGERNFTDDPDEFIKLLACGCSLISFEVTLRSSDSSRRS
jgi:hypothetical protein